METARGDLTLTPQKPPQPLKPQLIADTWTLSHCGKQPLDTLVFWRGEDGARGFLPPGLNRAQTHRP